MRSVLVAYEVDTILCKMGHGKACDLVVLEVSFPSFAEYGLCGSLENM